MSDNANAAIYFVERHIEEGRDTKTAFIEGERKLSYGSLSEQTGRMVSLLERHGFRREERIALLLHDVIEFPTIFWGALKAGVIPIAINTLLTTEQYRYILSDSRARALFVSAPLLQAVKPLLNDLHDLRAVFVVGATDPTGLHFSDELAASPVEKAVVASPDETAFWLYSSGSTGEPKGVRHVHSALKATSDSYGCDVLGIREDDTVLSAAKLFFAYGLGNSMTFPLSVGATSVLLPARPTPQAVFEVMSRHRPTIFFGVPTLYAGMLAEAGQSVPGTDRLRISVSAGEALPEDIGLRWSKLTNTGILDGVGSTEMLHIFLSNTPDDIEYGTSGRAVPGYDLRLVDTEDALVADDEIGELLVNGGSGSEGYWNKRAKTRETFQGAWTRTGDKYIRRSDGRYVYCGRTDDMFKVSGQWVSPFEVEQALVSHQSVLEAAVVPALDDDGLERPKAFVISSSTPDDIDAEELKQHVKAAIGNWKYPRWIEVVEELPKTATGKIQRFKLR